MFVHKITNYLYINLMGVFSKPCFPENLKVFLMKHIFMDVVLWIFIQTYQVHEYSVVLGISWLAPGRNRVIIMINVNGGGG